MKKKQVLALTVLLTILFLPIACGKKGPPFLPERDLTLRVTQLSAEWKDGAFRLKGNVVGPQNEIEDPSHIKGCRVFHACYPLDNPPCDDCPIEYKFLKEIEDQVISEGLFSCEILEEKEVGIHFFLVYLLGQRGETGPFSDRAKLTINN